MSWWETLDLVTWWKRLGISAIKTGQDAPSWIWCTERLSFFGGGHILLQRFVHVQCHFQPPLLNWSLLILTVAHMTCKVVYDVFYVNLQNQKNLTPAVSKKTPEILALTNRGKDPTSRPHVTLGIRGSSQWIVTGSLIAAPMHMVKTSNWAKYLDVSGKKNLWAYKYCILPVGVKLHASRSPHLHLRIWLQAF